jgi:hypothetical protein
MTATIQLDADTLNELVEGLKPAGYEWAANSNGEDASEFGFRDDERLTYYTFVENYSTGKYDIDTYEQERILVIRRNADETYFGVRYEVDVDNPNYRTFRSMVTLNEIKLTETIVIKRDYAF